MSFEMADWDEQEVQYGNDFIDKVEYNTAHYDVLGLDFDATDADIKKAFKKKVLKAHPDKGGSSAKFDKVKKAHDCLSDPEKREKYDGAKGIPMWKTTSLQMKGKYGCAFCMMKQKEEEKKAKLEGFNKNKKKSKKEKTEEDR